jgi:hypothetical protein
VVPVTLTSRSRRFCSGLTHCRGFPVSYIEFLRHCMEPTSHRVTLVRAELNSADTPAKRFEMLVSQLQESLPAIEYPVAREISLIADQDRSLPEPVE